MRSLAGTLSRMVYIYLCRYMDRVAASVIRVESAEDLREAIVHYLPGSLSKGGTLNEHSASLAGCLKPLWLSCFPLLSALAR
jgi:hypothetical protein